MNPDLYSKDSYDGPVFLQAGNTGLLLCGILNLDEILMKRA